MTVAPSAAEFKWTLKGQCTCNKTVHSGKMRPYLSILTLIYCKYSNLRKKGKDIHSQVTQVCEWLLLCLHYFVGRDKATVGIRPRTAVRGGNCPQNCPQSNKAES